MVVAAAEAAVVEVEVEAVEAVEAVEVPLPLEAPAVLAAGDIPPLVPLLVPLLVPVPVRKAKARAPSEIVL